MKALVKWRTNYADEFDVEGFVIVEKREWEKFENYSKNRTVPFYISIGTNECIKYQNGYGLLKDISTILLSEQEAKLILSYVGNYYGFCNFWDYEDEDI